MNNACIFTKTKQRKRLKDFAASKAIQRPSSANYDIKSNYHNSIITRCKICTAGAARFKKDHNIPTKCKAALCCFTFPHPIDWYIQRKINILCALKKER